MKLKIGIVDEYNIIQLIGAGLFVMGMVSILWGVIPPNEGTWILVSIVKPIQFYVVFGIMTFIGFIMTFLKVNHSSGTQSTENDDK